MSMTVEHRDKLIQAIAKEVAKQNRGKKTEPTRKTAELDSQALANVLDDMMHGSDKVPRNA